MVYFARSEAQWRVRKTERKVKQEHVTGTRSCARAGSSQLRSVGRARLAVSGTAFVLRMQRAPSLRVPAVLAAAQPRSTLTVTCGSLMSCLAAAGDHEVRSPRGEARRPRWSCIM